MSFAEIMQLITRPAYVDDPRFKKVPPERPPVKPQTPKSEPKPKPE